MPLTCMAVVDPISTGGCLAAEVTLRGHAVVAVWSTELDAELRTHVPEAARSVQYLSEVEEQETLEQTAASLREACGGLDLLGVVCGFESGVYLADALSENLGLLTNGTALGARRNKDVQQRLVERAGLRAVRGACSTVWFDVAKFVASEPMPVVVKPVESAGSDGVKLCHSVEEAEEHFNLLMTTQRKLGSQGAAVLCQEFLKGREYVVDHVTRNGVHKTVMVWMYDKRPCNGSEFVYYGMIPIPADAKEVQKLIPYTRGVLDALGIKNGATHGEVMMTEEGPCLVEMNCRAHGLDGCWAPLARALTGYSQVDAAIDIYDGQGKFDALPSVFPSPFKAAGLEVMLVSTQAGVVSGTPGYDKIRTLKSFVSLRADMEVGSRLELSLDLFSTCGVVILLHPDPAVLEADLANIRQMEIDCTLFEVEDA